LNFLEHLLDAYGYAAIFLIIGLENVGLLVPGETILITAGIYAGETHRLNIVAIVGTAAVAACAGGIAGFAIGQYGERHLLHRYGRYLHLDEKDLRLGRYLFRRYGGLVVFVARFVAFLRALAGLLAGINGMEWTRFLLFNGLGAVLWASTFGFAAYALGDRIEALSTRASIILGVLVAVVAVAGLRFLHRNRARLQREADRAFAPNK
jgi:membrane protein DedA with SNARE-associated domain